MMDIYLPVWRISTKTSRFKGYDVSWRCSTKDPRGKLGKFSINSTDVVIRRSHKPVKAFSSNINRNNLISLSNVTRSGRVNLVTLNCRYLRANKDLIKPLIWKISQIRYRFYVLLRRGCVTLISLFQVTLHHLGVLSIESAKDGEVSLVHAGTVLKPKSIL